MCITGRGIEIADQDQKWLDEQLTFITGLGYSRKNLNPFKCVGYVRNKGMF